MLHKTITYTDFNGNKITEDHYFHLSKTDLVDMEAEVNGGLAEYLNKIQSEKNSKEIWAFFKKIISKAYGLKTPDGKRFVKREEITNDFLDSGAFDELIFGFFQDASSAVAFVNGILPALPPKSE